MAIEEATSDELRWLIIELTECTPISFEEIEKRLTEIRALFRRKEDDRSIH